VARSGGTTMRTTTSRTVRAAAGDAGPRTPAQRTSPRRAPAGSGPGLRAEVRVPGRLVALSGRLDVAAAADVRLLLVEAVSAGEGDLVLDLSGLGVLDAPGLGVLVGAHRRALRAGRTLVLRDVTDPVARLLFLSRLDRVLRVEPRASVA